MKAYSGQIWGIVVKMDEISQSQVTRLRETEQFLEKIVNTLIFVIISTSLGYLYLGRMLGNISI